MKNKGIICYRDNLTDIELEAVNLYWELDDTSNCGFRYTVAQLQSKFKGRISSINYLIKKKSCFTFDSPSSACNLCGDKTIAYKRKDVIDIKNSDMYVCGSCIDKKRESEKQEEKRRKQDLYLAIKNIKREMLSGSYSVISLTYVEKLYLFLLLSEHHKGEGEPLKIESDNFCLAGCVESDHQYIGQLSHKKVLVLIKEVPEEVRVLADKVIFEGPNALSRHDWIGNLRKSENHLITHPFKAGIYLRQSEEFENTASLLQALYTDICEMTLTKLDVEDISILVESVRLSNLYNIISWISDECRIPVEKSLKLENLLKHLAKTLPLRVCCWLLYSQADKVAAHLHKSDTPDFISKRLLAKKTDDYITLAKEKGWEFTYTKKLPDTIETSALESLVADHFLDGHFNWQLLTTSEIIAGWMSHAKFVDDKNLPK